jgi:hypothetical protein
VAALVSFLPTAVLNVIYCHDWSGLNLEHAGMDMKNPFVGMWGNALLFLLSNFAPPFFPLAGWWNQNALSVLPHGLVAPLVANFEQGFHILGELPTEDATGIGFGVSLLATASLLGSLWYSRRMKRKIVQDAERLNVRAIPLVVRRCALITPWIALLAYCMKSGMVTGARLISPYYPLILALILTVAGSTKVVRTGWWRVLVWVNFLLAVPVLVLTPGRPLWPAETVLSKLQAAHPASHAVARALDVYRIYAIRFDPLASVRELLPASVKTVGFLGTDDDIDISLWRPFGSRRVEHVLLTDTAEDIRRRGVEYVVVGGFELAQKATTLDEWLERVHGKVVATTSGTIKVAEGRQRWYVVRLQQTE